MKLSVIVPCYNEQEVLPYFFEEILHVERSLTKKNISMQIIFVNDGSLDRTEKVLENFCNIHPQHGFIDFSRNFGKESAMLAGLEVADGDLVAIMDADLQDPPHLLPDMIEKIQTDGYDAVVTYRQDRKGEPPIRSYFARKFYKIINKLIDVQIVDGARDYRIMTRQVVNALLQNRERNRFSKGLFPWVGFNTYLMPYQNTERVAGETKWSFWKLFGYAIEGIVSFSTVPLRISTFIGFFTSLLAFIFTATVVIRQLFFHQSIEGWSSTISIILFTSAIQFIFIGIIGEYLGKIYTEIKQRPHYVVKRKLGLNRHEETN